MRELIEKKTEVASGQIDIIKKRVDDIRFMLNGVDEDLSGLIKGIKDPKGAAKGIRRGFQHIKHDADSAVKNVDAFIKNYK